MEDTENQENGSQENQNEQVTEPVDQVSVDQLQADLEKWKAMARKNEDRAKQNAAAAAELAKQQEAAKSESERIAALEKALEAERNARAQADLEKRITEFAGTVGVPVSALEGKDESKWEQIANDLLGWRNSRGGNSPWTGSGDPSQKTPAYDGYQRAIDELKRKNKS